MRYESIWRLCILTHLTWADRLDYCSLVHFTDSGIILYSKTTRLCSCLQKSVSLQMLTLSNQRSHYWLPGGALLALLPFALCKGSRLHLLPCTVRCGMHHTCTSLQRGGRTGWVGLGDACTKRSLTFPAFVYCLCKIFYNTSEHRSSGPEQISLAACRALPESPCNPVRRRPSQQGGRVQTKGKRGRRAEEIKEYIQTARAAHKRMRMEMRWACDCDHLCPVKITP